MSNFKLSPGANVKAKRAINLALAKGEPYCVICIEGEADENKRYRVLPYTGLAIDRKKVSLEFFCSDRVEPEILRREGIIW